MAVFYPDVVDKILEKRLFRHYVENCIKSDTFFPIPCPLFRLLGCDEIPPFSRNDNLSIGEKIKGKAVRCLRNGRRENRTLMTEVATF